MARTSQNSKVEYSVLDERQEIGVIKLYPDDLIPFMDSHVVREGRQRLLDSIGENRRCNVIGWSLHQAPGQVLPLSIQNALLPRFIIAAAKLTHLL